MALVIVTCAVEVSVTRSQEIKAAPKALSTLAKGHQILASNCAACHGIDAKGSERAPNIADSPHIRQLSDTEVSRIIGNGISGTGMPAFRSLSNAQVHELVAYLRSLEGTTNHAKLPGDPQKGEPVFFGKTGCSNCHMIAGKGGFIASDLTAYASAHSAEQIRNAILESSSEDRQKVKLATAVLRTGETYIGRIRNEDNFSLQLQTLDGSFHFIMKSDLEKLELDPQPLMPNNFGSTLTTSELNDLISYLLSAAGNNDPQRRANENDRDNLEN